MIRRATPEDSRWIVDVGADVYVEFGDYGKILPSWIHHPGVLVFVETDDSGERRGFILVGFYAPDESPPGTFVADLLAIAVAPAHQGQGIGRRLLDYAVDLTGMAAKQAHVRELRLTVAHTNLRAQTLFRKAGFEVIDANHGAYDGGQRAIRMRRRV